jgi:hypothetical protein
MSSRRAALIIVDLPGQRHGTAAAAERCSTPRFQRPRQRPAPGPGPRSTCRRTALSMPPRRISGSESLWASAARDSLPPRSDKCSQQQPHLFVGQCNPRSQLPLRRVDRAAQQGTDPVQRRRALQPLGGNSVVSKSCGCPCCAVGLRPLVLPVVQSRLLRFLTTSASAAAPTTRVCRRCRCPSRQVQSQGHHHAQRHRHLLRRQAAVVPVLASAVPCALAPQADDRVRAVARHHAPTAHRQFVRRAAVRARAPAVALAAGDWVVPSSSKCPWSAVITTTRLASRASRSRGSSSRRSSSAQR